MKGISGSVGNCNERIGQKFCARYILEMLVEDGLKKEWNRNKAEKHIHPCTMIRRKKHLSAVQQGKFVRR